MDEDEEEDENALIDISVWKCQYYKSNIFSLYLIFKSLDSDILADVNDKEVKIIKKKLNSLRLDTLLKAGLGVAKK